MKKTTMIDDYQKLDEKDSRYCIISKQFTYYWNKIFIGTQTNIKQYKKTLGSDIRNMVLAKMKTAGLQQSNENDMSAVCESFMKEYNILTKHCPSAIRYTKTMFREVSLKVADVFRVPISELREGHFLNDVALQVFIEYIRISSGYLTLRPMVKRFYSYLFYEQVGEAYKYDPRFIEVCNTIYSINKEDRNKRTLEKTKAGQGKEHPLLQEYVEYRKGRGKEAKEKYTIRKFFGFFCDMHDVNYDEDLVDIDLSKISTSDIEQFVGHLMSLTKLDEKDARHIKVETVSVDLAHIRRFFKYLVQRGHIRKNPVDSIEPIKVKRKRNYRYATQEQCEDFLETVHRISKDPITDMSMFQLAMYLGLRPSEVVGLKVGDFDLENGKVSFIRAKSHKEDILELPSFLVAWLMNYIKTHPDYSEDPEAPMFYNCRKRPMTYLTYQQRYYKSRKNMKNPIPKEMKGPHILRHTLASVLLDNNTRLDKVSAVLGHTTIHHTDAYLHTGKLGVEKAVENYIGILTKGEEKSNGNQT